MVVMCAAVVEDLWTRGGDEAEVVAKRRHGGGR